MEQQLEVQKQFRNQQEKLTYYIIALCVTSIGFSVYKTSGSPLSYNQIPLGLAVASWGISIYCGITFLKILLTSLFANNTYYEVINGNHPETGNHPQKIEAAVKGLNNALSTNRKKAKRLSTSQDILFYSGIILFLVWHILEMYKIT
tara:strand:+ start:655 stop:1095 length:441 start_codon:yes stop_codon:yes gene_type:complete